MNLDNMSVNINPKTLTDPNLVLHLARYPINGMLNRNDICDVYFNSMDAVSGSEMLDAYDTDMVVLHIEHENTNYYGSYPVYFGNGGPLVIPPVSRIRNEFFANERLKQKKGQNNDKMYSDEDAFFRMLDVSNSSESVASLSLSLHECMWKRSMLVKEEMERRTDERTTDDEDMVEHYLEEEQMEEPENVEENAKEDENVKEEEIVKEDENVKVMDVDEMAVEVLEDQEMNENIAAPLNDQMDADTDTADEGDDEYSTENFDDDSDDESCDESNDESNDDSIETENDDAVQNENDDAIENEDEEDDSGAVMESDSEMASGSETNTCTSSSDGYISNDF